MPTLAILKLDQIGDYVIFRNFIEEIKKSDKYKDYKIILIGNIVYKKFAQNFDGKLIDAFIGVNKRNFRKYPLYRAFIANEINSQKIDVLISPTYSRDAQWVENLVKVIKAQEKIGSSGDGTNITLGQKREADRRYTQLISQTETPLFEFDRYKEFFEQLLEKKISLKVPQINVEEVSQTRLVGFFPSAGAKYRCWNALNFAKLAELIKENFGYKICILGTSKDKKIAKNIMKNSTADFIDMTGKIPLEKLPQYCKKMQFIVTNDTSGLHIGSAIGVKTLCISNGNNYPRFVQYPNKDVVSVVYPNDVEKQLKNEEYVRKELLYGSIVDINSVTVEKVFEALNKLVGVKVAKAPAKKVVKKEAEKKTVTKKVTAVKKTSVKKEVEKKEPAKKVTAKKTTTAKTTSTKKPVAKKATATEKKTATKKTATKKTVKKEEK